MKHEKNSQRAAEETFIICDFYISRGHEIKWIYVYGPRGDIYNFI